MKLRKSFQMLLINYIEMEHMKIYRQDLIKLLNKFILPIVFMTFTINQSQGYSTTLTMSKPCAVVSDSDLDNLINLYAEYAINELDNNDCEVKFDNFVIFVSFCKIDDCKNCYSIQIDGVDNFDMGFDEMITCALKPIKSVRVMISDAAGVGIDRFYRVISNENISIHNLTKFHIVHRAMPQIKLMYIDGRLTSVEIYTIYNNDSNYFNENNIQAITSDSVNTIIH